MLGYPPIPQPRPPGTAGPTHGCCAVEVRERKGETDIHAAITTPLTPPTNATGSAPTDRLPVLLPRRARGAPLRQRGPVPMRAALSLLHRQAGAGRRLPPPALPRPPPVRDCINCSPRLVLARERRVTVLGHRLGCCGANDSIKNADLADIRQREQHAALSFRAQERAAVE